MKTKAKRTPADETHRAKGTEPKPERGAAVRPARAKERAKAETRVFLKRAPGGGWRLQWVGRYTVDGKQKDVTLCRWAGTPPETSTGTGDAAFEQSRERAREMLAEAIRKDAPEGERAVYVQRIHAIRYGGKVERVKIADLSARWDALPHKADMTEERRERVHSVLKRFRDFMQEHFPAVSEAGALTAEHFKGFLDAVDASGVSARSWNDYLSILRGVLRKVDGQGRGFREYLAPLPKKVEKTVHRRAFDESELEAIYTAAARVDPELRPVLVAAACTALRRGDVCRLRWDAIDLAEGFATVNTAKTGETVEIPIFQKFREVLEDAARKRKAGVPYVFPKIALAYARNADGLNDRLNRVLAAAGFSVPKRTGKAASGEGKAKRHDNAGKYEAPGDFEAAEIMLEEGMAREGWKAKRKDRARRILALHFQGRKGKEIAEEIGASAGTVSDYLHEMEDAGRIALVSPPKLGADAKSTMKEIGDGEQRKQRGSLCGWHSFRTSFVTLALNEGVAIELVMAITGHRKPEVLLKYYNQPRRKQLQKAYRPMIAGAIGDGGKGKGRGKGRKGKGKAAADFEAVVLPPELAGLLENASAADLKKVAALLKKKGGK